MVRKIGFCNGCHVFDAAAYTMLLCYNAGIYNHKDEKLKIQKIAQFFRDSART